MIRLVALMLLIGGAPALAVAVSEADATVRELTPEQEARFVRLEEMLKCPVCKNQSIASSESFLSKEMKRILRERIATGETDEQILAYFEGRYGQWILLAPPMKGRNLPMYILPGAGALFVGGAIFLWLRRARRQEPEPVSPAQAAPGEWGEEAKDLVEKELNT